MNRTGIICDLLTWLEGQLDQPLSLDDVASRSGYSKWHLQRKFKETTGQVLGAYIRARRLSNAAMALRLTSKTLADIALQYHFESQQTFTRAFKKQFQQTPAFYRRSLRWDFYGMQPPIRSAAAYTPADIVVLPALRLEGITRSYTCRLEELSQFRSELRTQFWRTFLEQAQSNPPVLYGLCYSRPSGDKNGENEVFYTTAAEPDYLPVKRDNLQNLMLNAGDYAQFTYQGAPEGLQGFIMDLYGVCLPMMRLVRRDGYDIERFHRWPTSADDAGRGDIHCDYLIPIMRPADDGITPTRGPAA
ncbi:MDR efflux pump AcrAB transcriptional activator RobA [Acerihabitans arboris]|uniref:MDR efflux pump AcrAB transcriptional activator RobA n=1 Tax=Acerihabitans arboris TaxID=2691583 RepID=A0A845SG14_9GAMM|nr:MDR efflux pump AcrAB transcriptional activator RobA [Acerihabitans arboris]NDL62267.1 MDR efflux pump AcrAB transcriptional activator RobA [Acerihabitans arboris]